MTENKNTNSRQLFLNPSKKQTRQLDKESEAIILKTIEFFEQRGKSRLKKDDHDRTWYADFLEFAGKEKIFSKLMTPRKVGGPTSRWDTWRICEFNEILGFYGLNYWYTWQVSMLGLGPIWMSENHYLVQKAREMLENGGIFAFGLSEKEHGADLYSSEMKLIQESNGSSPKWKAKGRKYYIGNANKAALVSTFGKMEKSDEFVFFAARSDHPNYRCVKNVVNSQNYVAEYELNDYPITESDILSQGSAAWDAALNTINICKFNLGWASIGICTHAFYEAITHASNRNLFGKYVTDFPHIQGLFVDAYSRLAAMKLFSLRAIDYMRNASQTDRRYLLFNPMVKMKVTTQGEEVINHIWDVIAAKGFEKDMYFEGAARDIRALPKLEGTVHVNMALIVKFMKNYFFHPKEFEALGKCDSPKDDHFLFEQGPTKGLGKIQFHDYRKAYSIAGLSDLPNVKILKKQISDFKTLLALASPNKEQTKDFDFLLILGELFTLTAYGQLILENSEIYKIENELVDQIFDVLVRDFSKYALQLYSKPSSTRLQRLLALKIIRKPHTDSKRFDKVWREHVMPLNSAYAMSPGSTNLNENARNAFLREKEWSL